nr:fluoride efflux transporter CrcB [Patulibacter sp. SYSU D01012]
MLWLGVALLGGVGAVLRYAVDEAVRRRVAGPFPAGILVVNVSGTLVLGLLAGLALPHDAALLLGTALVGAYTTFSTWMLDTVGAASRGMVAVAAANVVLSLALGVAAAALGRAFGAAL